MNSVAAAKRMHKRTPAPGFTLIEVLVAVAITLMVATAAYSLFHQSIDAVEQGSEVLEEINQVESVWQILSTDLNHAVNRATPGAVVGAALVPSFIGGEAARNSGQIYEGEYVLRLVRDGWSNPLQQQRSELQRVGYRWFDGQLWRDYWAEKNQPLDEEPLGHRLLLNGLEEIRVRFLPGGAGSVVSNDWLDSWPAGAALGAQGQQGIGANTPVAMEVTLTVAELGEVQRIFAFTQ